MDTSRRALVLGSGGLTGLAWQVGVLEGLADAGLSWNADLLVGTSAGALLAARLAAGEAVRDVADALGSGRAFGSNPGKSPRPPGHGGDVPGAVPVSAAIRLVAAQLYPHRRQAVVGLGRRAGGEEPSTGEHGATSQATNSLLEAVVMGTRAAQDLAEGWRTSGARAVATAHALAAVPATPLRDGDRPASGLRRAMFGVVGVLRDGATLAPLVAQWQDEVADWVRLAGARPGDGGRFDAVPTATLAALAIAWSALRREESRGAHTRVDFPEPRPAEHQTFVIGDLLLSDVLA